MDFSGNVSMGLIGSNSPSGASVSPVVGLDVRFDFSVETDSGLTIGLTLPVSTEGTRDGWSISISDQ